jgi:hypothetical protein
MKPLLVTQPTNLPRLKISVGELVNDHISPSML